MLSLVICCRVALCGGLGVKIAKFSIATSENWKNKQTGEREERTEWHRVVVFGGLAEVVENYVTKGMKVYIEGKIVIPRNSTPEGWWQVIRPPHSWLHLSATAQASSATRARWTAFFFTPLILRGSTLALTF
ncbi:single-stranded DNA-binding protein [Rhizobium leguminosarum]|nr:single-stranded DNA-binding protein [Rhizobium leguminosarum]